MSEVYAQKIYAITDDSEYFNIPNPSSSAVQRAVISVPVVDFETQTFTSVSLPFAIFLISYMIAGLNEQISDLEDRVTVLENS
jgi:hypothetical protein